MICPNCNKDHPKVEETRTTDEVIWRVRRCGGCGWRVTTKEIYASDEEQSIPHSIRRGKANKGAS